MTFAGWVPIRRTILEHTIDGRLSTTEYAVFSVLILLADRHTGAGRINAAALRTYLPGLKYETAKRVLTSLQKKGYLWRSIKPRSTAVYPYWINHYEITDGPQRMSQTNLSQVFATGDISTITYDRHVPEDTLQSTPRSTPENTPRRPHYNNKDNNKDTDKDPPVIADLPKVHSIHSKKQNEETGAIDCQSDSAISFVLPAASKCANLLPDPPKRPGYVPDGDLSCGRWKDHAGRLLEVPESREALASLGFEQYGAEFYLIGTGHPIQAREALPFIANGGPLSERRVA